MSNCTLCPCAILAGCKKSKAEVIILFPATSADVSVRHKWSSTSLAICYTLLLASLYHDRPSLEPTTYAQSSEANLETSLKFGFSEKKICVVLLTRASCSVPATAYLSKSWWRFFKTNVVKLYHTNFIILVLHIKYLVKSYEYEN